MVDVLDERGTTDGIDPVYDNHGVKTQGHVLDLLDVVTSGEERVFHGVFKSVEKLSLALFTVSFQLFLTLNVWMPAQSPNGAQMSSRQPVRLLIARTRQDGKEEILVSRSSTCLDLLSALSSVIITPRSGLAIT